MKVVVTEREALNVVGMKIQTSVEEDRIPRLWNDFISRMEELKDVAVPDCSLGICINNEEEEFNENVIFDYLVCKVVKDDRVVPPGMVFRHISRQLVAVFTHIGSLDTLGETYDYIYNKWLPSSDYQLAAADEIEWYDSRFKFGESDSQMDVHIPIEKKGIEETINDGLFFANEV